MYFTPQINVFLLKNMFSNFVISFFGPNWNFNGMKFVCQILRFWEYEIRRNGRLNDFAPKISYQNLTYANFDTGITRNNLAGRYLVSA